MADHLPRLPIQASLDLTYRCNNRCRHCWLWEASPEPQQAAGPATAAEPAHAAGPPRTTRPDGELTTQEWLTLIDQARALGVRRWAISGGEPLLRADFPEIFEHATSRAVGYTLNTNGTLITPAIARLLRRPGVKLVAVYGATADVYDHVTRHPGGFEKLIRGLAHLREAGAGFTIQLVPMRDNLHQWALMVEFARQWSPHYRCGAPWLYKTACGDAARNAEIERQRVDPSDVVNLDRPDPTHSGSGQDHHPPAAPGDDRPYAACIATRREFHVDPYGGMSFCSFIKDPALRTNLRADLRTLPPGAVEHAWEVFIPSLADTLRVSREYRESCGSCALRSECRWCDAYGYLEHRRHGARVDYLCAVARATRAFKEDWTTHHRRFFHIAGVTIQVDSDLPITPSTFHSRFASFRADGPGPDTVRLHHHFTLPERNGAENATLVHRRPPWAIYRSGGPGRGNRWIYHGISPRQDDPTLHRIAVFSADHSRGRIYNDATREQAWLAGGLTSLTMFPSDQIWIARLLAERNACYLHSGALTIDGTGLLFAGHSEAGKSTTMDLIHRALGNRVRVLCDDRNIVRYWPQGFAGGAPGHYVHGTWSHGDVTDVSSAHGPLAAILFLEQAPANELIPLTDRREIWRRLLAVLIRPLVTADWMEREMDVLAGIVDRVPCHLMRFDRSGAIVPELERLVASLA